MLRRDIIIIRDTIIKKFRKEQECYDIFLEDDGGEITPEIAHKMFEVSYEINFGILSFIIPFRKRSRA